MANATNNKIMISNSGLVRDDKWFMGLSSNGIVFVGVTNRVSVGFCHQGVITAAIAFQVLPASVVAINPPFLSITQPL